MMCVTDELWQKNLFGTEVLNSTQYLLTSHGQFYFAEIRDGSLTIVMNRDPFITAAEAYCLSYCFSLHVYLGEQTEK